MREQLKNGQVNQQIRRRPGLAVASPRATEGRFPRMREDFGAAGADPAGFDKLTQSPLGRLDGRRRTATRETATWNGSNRSGNGTANGSTALATNRGEDVRLRTGWDLPDLIRPLPRRKRQCQAGKPRLLPHQPALVEYVYLSRFATASQVQRRFPDWLRSARTTQWQLANLVQWGFLATAPVRSTSPNFPFVYFTTGKGVTLINETYANHGLSKSHPPGEGRKASGVALESILHELLLTEFELAVRTTVDSRPDLSLLATERRYFRRELQLRFSHLGKSHRVIPDAGFVTRVGGLPNGSSQNASLTTLLNFVELDNGTMAPVRVLEKLEQYATWAASEAGERYLRNSYASFGVPVPKCGFRLLLVAHDKLHAGGDQKRLAALFERVLELPATMRDRVWLATAADLKAHQNDSPPLSADIWYRGRDAKAWLAAFEHIFKHNTNTSRRQFVTDRLAQLPRHCLFSLPAMMQAPQCSA